LSGTARWRFQAAPANENRSRRAETTSRVKENAP
jgi:hypothetical protein